MGQLEYGDLRGFGCDVRFQVRRQFRLNVLSGILPVLRRSSFAGDVGRFRIEVQPASGQAAQFVRPQPGLNCRGVQGRPFFPIHPVSNQAGLGRYFESLPFLGQQHPAFPPPVGLGVGLGTDPGSKCRDYNTLRPRHVPSAARFLLHFLTC